MFVFRVAHMLRPRASPSSTSHRGFGFTLTLMPEKLQCSPAQAFASRWNVTPRPLFHEGEEGECLRGLIVLQCGQRQTKHLPQWQ